MSVNDSQRVSGYELEVTNTEGENVILMCDVSGIPSSVNCLAGANPSVTSYQLSENDDAIFDANHLGMWERNVLTGGVFIYKSVANNSLGSEVSSSVMVTVNGKHN